METRNENAVAVVGIFEKSIEAAKGFESAAENAENESLKRYLIEKSNQRSKFVEALRIELLKNDSAYDARSSGNSGCSLGDLEQVYHDIKTYFTSTTDESLLEEVISGDQATLEELDDVLNEEYLSLELRNILRSKFQVIKKEVETIKTLKDVELLFV